MTAKQFNRLQFLRADESQQLYTPEKVRDILSTKQSMANLWITEDAILIWYGNEITQINICDLYWIHTGVKSQTGSIVPMCTANFWDRFGMEHTLNVSNVLHSASIVAYLKSILPDVLVGREEESAYIARCQDGEPMAMDHIEYDDEVLSVLIKTSNKVDTRSSMWMFLYIIILYIGQTVCTKFIESYSPDLIETRMQNANSTAAFLKAMIEVEVMQLVAIAIPILFVIIFTIFVAKKVLHNFGIFFIIAFLIGGASIALGVFSWMDRKPIETIMHLSSDLKQVENKTCAQGRFYLKGFGNVESITQVEMLDALYDLEGGSIEMTKFLLANKNDPTDYDARLSFEFFEMNSTMEVFHHKSQDVPPTEFLVEYTDHYNLIVSFEPVE